MRAGRDSLLWSGTGECLKWSLYLAKLMSPGYPTPFMQSCHKIRNYLLHLVIDHGFRNLCFILNLNVSGFRLLLLVLPCACSCYSTDELTKVSPIMLSALFLNCVPNSSTNFISAMHWDKKLLQHFLISYPGVNSALFLQSVIHLDTC